MNEFQKALEAIARVSPVGILTFILYMAWRSLDFIADKVPEWVESSVVVFAVLLVVTFSIALSYSIKYVYFWKPNQSA